MARLGAGNLCSTTSHNDRTLFVPNHRQRAPHNRAPCNSARGGGRRGDSAIGRLLRPRRVVVRNAGLRPALRERDGRCRGRRKRKGHRELCYEGRCMAGLRGVAVVEQDCPKRPVPLGKLHQRADRSRPLPAGACPRATAVIRKPTNLMNLTSAAGCCDMVSSCRAGPGVDGSRRPHHRDRTAGEQTLSPSSPLLISDGTGDAGPVAVAGSSVSSGFAQPLLIGRIGAFQSERL